MFWLLPPSPKSPVNDRWFLDKWSSKCSPMPRGRVCTEHKLLTISLIPQPAQVYLCWLGIFKYGEKLLSCSDTLVMDILTLLQINESKTKLKTCRLRVTWVGIIMVPLFITVLLVHRIREHTRFLNYLRNIFSKIILKIILISHTLFEKIFLKFTIY